MKKWLFALGLTGLVALLVWANLRQASDQSASAAPVISGPASAPVVKVVSVAPHDLTQAVIAPGEVEPSEIVQVRAPFGTATIRLLVGPGDHVTAGQVIAELDSGDVRVQTASLQAALARAEANLASLLREQKAAPQQRKLRLEQAEAQLAQAQESLALAVTQPSQAKQRLEQATANLTSIQSRAVGYGAEVDQALRTLELAERNYRVYPLDADVRKAFEAARTEHEELVRRSEEGARQLAVELAAADETLRIAEAELAQTENSPAVIQARHQVENARQALESAKLDAESEHVIDEQVRAAHADVLAARETLANSSRRTEQAAVQAPITGTVLEVDIRSGQPVQQDQFLLEIGSLAQLRTRMRVDELDIGKISVGQTLTLKSSSLADIRFPGVVKRVAAHSSAQGGNAPGAFFEVQGQVENPNGKLRAGMSVEGRIVTDSRNSVMSVGLESIRETGSQSFVVVISDHKVQVRPVHLGLRTQTQVEVLEGLSGGEMVAVSPFTLVNSLKEGDAVRTEVTEWQDRSRDE